MALKFFEHFIWIASAMTHIGGGDEMWDEEDGFFYDVLRTPDGGSTRLKVQSMVGLLPLAAATVLHRRNADEAARDRRAGALVHRAPAAAGGQHPRSPQAGPSTTGALLAILGEDRLRRVLAHMLDEKEFLSPYGIRSLSAKHRDEPYNFWVGGQEFSVGYLPAESDSGMFGGNSNWRGPIWMPINALLDPGAGELLRATTATTFKVEFPTGSGRKLNLYRGRQGAHPAAGRHLHPG